MTSSPKIAAVFATMNRAQTAVACVEALAGQTRPPDLVVVADNVSCDETVSALKGMGALPFPLKVIEMPDNRGNAGGVEVAMDHAFGQGMDAVWILDDDSFPRASAVEELLAGDWDRKVVRHSIQIDPATGKFTWPMQVWTGREFDLADGPDDIPSGDFIRTRIMWTGALVSKEVRDTIGRVNAGLFIRGEDEEYPWRMEKGGFAQEAALRSVLDHKGPDDLVHLKFLGKNLFLERGLNDWKLYYKIRNMVWLRLRQAGWLSAIFMAAAYLVAVSWVDGAQRIPLILSAAKDGLIGRLGKWQGH